jgi:hypothetical protein
VSSPTEIIFFSCLCWYASKAFCQAYQQIILPFLVQYYYYLQFLAAYYIIGTPTHYSLP